MNKRVLLVLSILAVLVAASALSGCTSTNTGTPSTGAGTGTGTITPTTAASTAGSGGKITVTQTADKITITGGKGEKMTSDKFPLSKDGWYIVKITFTGGDYSIFQSALGTQQMIDESEAIGGQLTNSLGTMTTAKILGKGSVNSDDYKIYIGSSDGQWTIEILKNPTGPLTTDTTFTGASDKVTPFFHLNQGSASFTMHQKLKSQYSSRLDVNLYNADTGTYVANLAHNDDTPTLTASSDIPTSGNYVLEVIGGGDWDISYTQ